MPHPPRTIFRFLPSFLLAATLFGLACSNGTDSLEELHRRQEAGDFASTIEPLRQRLEEFPKDGETQFLYGRALVATEQPALALFSLREAMQDPKWADRAAIQTAVASLLTGDYNEAVAATSGVLERDPDHVEALLYRAQARAHWRNGPEQALEDAERVLELEPGRLEAYEPLILSLLALDQPLEAEEALAEAGRRLLDVDADDAQLAWHCNTTALLALDMGETEKAAEQIETCLAKHPTDARVLETALRHFDARGDQARSIEIMRTAVEIEPASRAYRGLLAARLAIAGEPGEAEQILRAAAESSEGAVGAAAWVDLAELLHGQQRFGEAADAFREATRLDAASDPQLAFRYADALVLAGELEEAEERAKALTIEAHRKLIEARVAQQRGDDEAALAGFLAASQLWPDNPWARYFAGFSAARLGVWERALEEYRYSIRINAGASDARTQAARILAAQGDLSGAYHVLFLQADEHPLEPEGMVLGAYLIARISNAAQLQDLLTRHLATHPGSYPRALVRAAEGLAENGLPAAGMNLLAGAPGLDWTQARTSPVLLAYLRLAAAAGKIDKGRQFLAALETGPALPPGLAEVARANLAVAAGDSARAVYRAAAEKAPSRPEAWIGLGVALLPTPEEAAEADGAFERALELLANGGLPPAYADGLQNQARRGRARALMLLDKPQQAAELLEEVLSEDPLDRAAAVLRVEVDLQSDAVSPRTIEWARRAVRFGRQIPDYERLAAVYRRAGEPDLAAEAEQAIEMIRNSSNRGKTTPGAVHRQN